MIRSALKLLLPLMALTAVLAAAAIAA